MQAYLQNMARKVQDFHMLYSAVRSWTLCEHGAENHQRMDGEAGGSWLFYPAPNLTCDAILGEMGGSIC